MNGSSSQTLNSNWLGLKVKKTAKRAVYKSHIKTFA